MASAGDSVVLGFRFVFSVVVMPNSKPNTPNPNLETTVKT